MKIIYFILAPIIFLIIITCFSFVVELLRQPSDIAVLAGVSLASLLLLLIYFIIKSLKK